MQPKYIDLIKNMAENGMNVEVKWCTLRLDERALVYCNGHFTKVWKERVWLTKKYCYNVKNLFYVWKISLIKANTPKITLNSKIYFNFFIFISMVVFWHSSVQLTLIYLHPEFRALKKCSTFCIPCSLTSTKVAPSELFTHKIAIIVCIVKNICLSFIHDRFLSLG